MPGASRIESRRAVVRHQVGHVDGGPRALVDRLSLLLLGKRVVPEIVTEAAENTHTHTHIIDILSPCNARAREIYMYMYG